MGGSSKHLTLWGLTFRGEDVGYWGRGGGDVSEELGGEDVEG